MKLYSGKMNRLVEELSSLPGIGEKSAGRLADHLIRMPEDRVRRLAEAMIDARENVHFCKECFTLTDEDICPVCSNDTRDHHTVMIVEDTRDMQAYEKTGKYAVIGTFVMPLDAKPKTGGKPKVILPAKPYPLVEENCGVRNAVIGSPSTPSDDYIHEKLPIAKKEGNGTVFLGFDE
ncbi:MAG: recombination protein RecR [Methanosarcinaceae archaeon]|nr:recombination protein RecR [Methanosarcinaceae archaeon]